MVVIIHPQQWCLLLVSAGWMCEVEQMKVYDSMHYGRENTIPSKMLAEVLELQTVRDLQKQIERERAAGAVILSDSYGGGYYLSNDPEKLLCFTRTLNARARNTIKAAQSAQRAVDAAIGQERMEGWWE